MKNVERLVKETFEEIRVLEKEREELAAKLKELNEKQKQAAQSVGIDEVGTGIGAKLLAALKSRKDYTREIANVEAAIGVIDRKLEELKQQKAGHALVSEIHKAIHSDLEPSYQHVEKQIEAFVEHMQTAFNIMKELGQEVATKNAEVRAAVQPFAELVDMSEVGLDHLPWPRIPNTRDLEKEYLGFLKNNHLGSYADVAKSYGESLKERPVKGKWHIGSAGSVEIIEEISKMAREQERMEQEKMRKQERMREQERMMGKVTMYSQEKMREQ
jgi:microcompartment protein CcmK/EutM